ncbi:TAFII55 protein conserved region-domain-containing protein [Russula earlei]|uniref:TAFII55 protein conserved region-domain-containing protein n=1 Tax=Russula earlei TaxID=71964 RepID=A0ACC0UA28_9AGAM|nr:TAFII55 protein conserved region-domain-containing protein [Russula earlei]
MDDDLIVVDDLDSNPQGAAGTIKAAPDAQPTQAATGRPQRAATLRARRQSSPAYSDSGDTASGRAMRSSAKAKAAPKLKLKLSEKAAALAPGMSFLGPYDRELDSDEEELSFEEQFILRFPPGEDCGKLREMVAAREISPEVWFKFKDSRRAVFHIGDNMYSAKLVDLPCIVEAQKTLDNKRMFKVADICQMLLVEKKISSEEVVSNQKSFNIDDFIWPHGITPPLHHVRKRRFRRRVNRRTIESVEQEVERLLEQDAVAEDVKHGKFSRHQITLLIRLHFVELLENVNPDLSDSEFIEPDDALEAHTPGANSEPGDAGTPGGGGDGDDSDDEEGEADGDIDEELAAELDRELEGEDDEEDDEDESEEEEEEDEDEDDETQVARQLLNEEIVDLEFAVRKKEAEVASTGNPLIRKRFEDALKKLRADLEAKMSQKDEMNEMARLRKAGVPAPDEGEGGEDAEDDEGVEPEEDVVDREESIPLPIQGLEIPAVIQLNGSESGQLPPPDGDLFGPEDSMDIG